MGNSISYVCCPHEGVRQRGEVLVIKEDGESLKFKDGTLVRDVILAYPYHKIIRCCSERTVLPSEAQLSCNWLYFLLPAGLALSEAAYQGLVRSAASQRLIASGASRMDVRRDYDRPKMVEAGAGRGWGNDDRQCQGRKGGLYDYSFAYKWKPDLMTIPEIASPSQ